MSEFVRTNISEGKQSHKTQKQKVLAASILFYVLTYNMVEREAIVEQFAGAESNATFGIHCHIYRLAEFDKAMKLNLFVAWATRDLNG